VLTAVYSFTVIITIVLAKIHEGLMPILTCGIGHNRRQFMS